MEIEGVKRIHREKATVGKMVRMYCRHRHDPQGELCEDCRTLLLYACQRLERCPKGTRKSSCRKCEIHCYSPAMKTRIREVMRYAGPRMLFIHPVAAIRHLIQELK